MTRGVLYYVWDQYNKAELDKSIKSVRAQGYEVHVQIAHNDLKGLSKKCMMYDASPFDTTLYLDSDTVVHGNLDYGFLQAEKHGMAMCIAPANGLWEVAKELRHLIHRDAVQYNSGVIFWCRGWDSEHHGFITVVEDVFDRWIELIKAHPIKADNNDQPAFSVAVAENLNPYVLPRTWNWRKGIRYEAQITHGSLKITHSKK